MKRTLLFIAVFAAISIKAAFAVGAGAMSQSLESPATQPEPLSNREIKSSPSSRFQDTALRTGTLSNGLRYYVRHNPFPANRAHLRLVVNAGSLLEDDDQQGFAHFLEHMAFNGTKNFPDHQLIEFIERAGMRFGADLNAYTSFDETVYHFSIPIDNEGLLQQGFQILQDWADGSILIDSAEVVAERGVVLGEWRSRLTDTASERIQKHKLGVIMGTGSPYLSRFPIGDPGLLEKAEAPELRRFYEDWYRTDLMAVIAVGDFNTDEIEQEIIARFSPIKPAENPRERIPSVKTSPADQTEKTLGLNLLSDTRIDILKGRFNPRVSVLWSRPKLPSDEKGLLIHQLSEELIFQSISRKFKAMTNMDRRPFFAAVLGKSRIAREFDNFYNMIVVADPDSLASGLQAALIEVDRIARHGLTADALNQRKAALLRRLESSADSEDAIPSQAIADAYTSHYLTGNGSLLGSRQRYELAKEVLPAITAESLSTMAQFWKVPSNRIVMVDMPEYSMARTLTESWIKASFDSVSSINILPDSVSATSVTSDQQLLTTPPNAGSIIEEKHYAEADVYEWALSNGAKVLYKQTNSSPDDVRIRAHSSGGSSLLPDSLAFSSGLLVDAVMTAAAGLGELDREELLERLSTTVLRQFQVSINYTDEEIQLAGSPKELETIFQMLYLQFTDPRIDTNALKSWKMYGRNTLQVSANDQIASTLSRGNPRLARPSMSQMQIFDVKQALAIYQDRFGDAGDFTFTIVGAGDSDDIRRFTELYIASLPSKMLSTREVAKDPEVRPWDGIDRKKGPNPRLHPKRAMTMFVFDGRFPDSPNEYLGEQQKLTTVTGVLGRRLRNQLREEMSITYSVGVSQRTYFNPFLHYQVNIGMDADPARIDTSNIMILRQIEALRSEGATQEELDQVWSVQQRALETNLQQNGFWMSTLQVYDQLGISFDHIVKPYSQPISPAEFKAAATKYLPPYAFIGRTSVPLPSAGK